jgi:uncharacterized protein YdaU (DUF1376 family)
LQGLFDRRFHSLIEFLRRQQDHWHGLRVERELDPAVNGETVTL